MAQLIKDGGYATSLSYVQNLCGIIERWNLTQYDSANAAEPTQIWYRVRKSWADAKSQKGAFHVLSNAKACADENPGYSVFDESGKAIYTGKSSGSQASFQPYLVKVSIADLNIRKGPGTNYAKTGKYTGIGVFTIVEESAGAGSDQGWGLLKSYQSGRNGWVSLDYCKRV